jgi:hypothetical protein
MLQAARAIHRVLDAGNLTGATEVRSQRFLKRERHVITFDFRSNNRQSRSAEEPETAVQDQR